MKKFISSFLMCALLILTFSVQFGQTANADEIVGGLTKGACLMDYNSGEIVYEKNGNTRRPIASMTKIMTLNLIFDEIKNGKLKYDDVVTVSSRASGMGGSQVFLDANGEYPVKELVKSIAVSSA
ncbi:MAG: serine hydrolase, partial [Clostridia bacterium]